MSPEVRRIVESLSESQGVTVSEIMGRDRTMDVSVVTDPARISPPLYLFGCDRAAGVPPLPAPRLEAAALDVVKGATVLLRDEARRGSFVAVGISETDPVGGKNGTGRVVFLAEWRPDLEEG